MIVPAGIITIWSGAIIDIPAGWILCNGNNGSPDLRDRFVVGAGSTYAVGANAGSVNHNHTFTTNGHGHDVSSGAAMGVGAVYANQTSNDTDSGTTDNASSLPPYYALAYIMRT